MMRFVLGVRSIPSRHASPESALRNSRDSLPTAKVELFGDRATLAFGAGGSVELVRERGLWKIEDLK